MSMQRLVTKCLMKCLLEVRLNAYYSCNLAVAPRLYGIKKLHQNKDNVKSGLLILGLLRKLHQSKKKKVGLYLFNMIQSFIKRIKSFYWKKQSLQIINKNLIMSAWVDSVDGLQQIAVAFEGTMQLVLANYPMRKTNHQLLLMESIKP